MKAETLHINIKSQSRVINNTYRVLSSKHGRRNKGNKIHRLIIDCIPVKNKKKDGAETIKTLIKRKHKWTTRATAQELCWRVQLGHTFTCNYLEGGLKNENFVSSSLLVLDFDNKTGKEEMDICHISMAQVLIRAYEYGLEHCFTYTTLSHTDTVHKFRMVFQLAETITDVNEFRLLIEQLFVIFPEADKSCRSAEKKFFGSSIGSVVYPQYDKYLDLNKLQVAARSCSTGKVTNSKNIIRDLNRHNKKYQIGGNSTEPSIYIEGVVENPQNALEHDETLTTKEFHNSNIETEVDNKINSSIFPCTARLPIYEKLTHINFDELCQRVQILNDFASGKKLLHPQLFGIASALQYIEGGDKWYKEIILRNSRYSNEKYHLVAVCKHSAYHVESLKNFSPYEQDCKFSNIYEAARVNRYHWRVIEEVENMTLETAESKLYDALKEALNAQGSPIIIIKKATGLGGTTQLAKLLGELNLKAVVSFPTHALKKEKIDLFSEYSPDLSVTPHLPLAISSVLRKKLDYYYKVGAYDAAFKLIKEYRKENSSLNNYFIEKINSFRHSDTVLTTHTQAIHVDFDNHKLYIFDEDPLKNILENGKVTFEDLKTLKDIVSDSKDKQILSTYIERIERFNIPSSIEKTIDIALDSYQAIENEVLKEQHKNLTSEVLRFLDSDYFVQRLAETSDSPRELNFITHHRLDKGFLATKKIIIISATASEFIYRKLYGDRVQFFDLSNVELQGNLHQDRSYSYSRRSMNQEKVIEYLNERTDGLPVITFNAFQSRIANAVPDIYFGKTEGFDEYKGRDLVVVGTPHLSTVDYLLYAATLGVEIKASDFRMSSEMITHNGIECYFNTFENKDLRKIQLHFIEEQLEQAIGRARLVRTDARVVVYTNFPLKNVSDYTTIRKLVST